MDKKNEAIIRILSREAGLSSRALSKMLKIPISTVHRRVKKLEHEGVIKGYKAIINFEKTASPIGALLMVNLAEVIPGKGQKRSPAFLEPFQRD
jgi:Lrp/AsnC family leucine-responsive transcriptional regulator